MASQWSEKEIRARAPNIDALIRLLADVESGKIETPGTARKQPIIRDTSHEFHDAAQVHTTIIAGQEVKTTTPVKGMGPGGRTAGVAPPALPSMPGSAPRRRTRALVLDNRIRLFANLLQAQTETLQHTSSNTNKTDENDLAGREKEKKESPPNHPLSAQRSKR